LHLGGLFGLSLPTLLKAAAASETTSTTARPTGTARGMILVWLGGGPSTIDMWDLKPNAPDAIRGEFSGISTTTPGVHICEHLPKMAGAIDKCTLIRSLKHSIPAHGPGSQYVMTGHLPSASTEYPSLGSVAARMLDQDGGVPPYVTFGNPPSRGAGYLGSAWNAFELDAAMRELPAGVSLGADPDASAFSRRIRLRDHFDQRFDELGTDRVAEGLRVFQQQSVEVLRRDSIRKALDLETAAKKDRELYGLSAVGSNALRARRLIAAGVRFVTVGMEGWDTHVNNFTQLRNNLLPELDVALAGLIHDLDRRGMLDETIVCCCGEFGRTPQINGSAGRDHWSSAISVLLAGGGFKAGHVHGATDQLGNAPIEGMLSPADLAATLVHCLGIDPGATTHTPSGRTMPIVRSGKVVDSLFG
jgi:hypothetical protein